MIFQLFFRLHFVLDAHLCFCERLIFIIICILTLLQFALLEIQLSLEINITIIA